MSAISQALSEAIALHQRGDIRRAERLYGQVLRTDPAHADALHLMGLAAHQQGNHQRAIELMLRAIDADRHAATYHANLGSVYFAVGETHSSIHSYCAAIALDPNARDVHFNLGNVYASIGRHSDACASYRSELANSSDHALAWQKLGSTLRLLQRDAEAVECFEKAISLQRESPGAYFELGNAHKSLGNFLPAVASYRRAIALAPGFAKAHNNLAVVLHDRGFLTEAVAEYRAALQADPQHVEAYNNLGTALKNLEHFNLAAECYRKALELKPDFAEAHFNLGNLLKDRFALEDAAAAYRRAITIDPAHYQARINLAVVLKDSDRFADAMAEYDRLLRMQPGCVEARFNRGLIWLQHREYERGWPEYEYRWHQNEQPQPHTEIPLWDGSTLSEKAILVHAEQGIGDEIMFASCLAEIAQQASACIVECDPRLVPLFARSLPQATVVAKGSRVEADVRIPTGSLPRYLRPTLESFPPQVRYLVADADGASVWNTRLRQIGKGLKIGISWRGGKDSDVRRKRSTQLARWARLLAIPGIDFINLQYGDYRDELEAVQKGTGITIHDFADCDPLRELDDFASLVSALDLVVSVDNSTVHLAGALGVPTWVLLPHVPDWRWLLDRRDSPWYASVRLFRQGTLGDWDGVFDSAAACLCERI